MYICTSDRHLWLAQADAQNIKSAGDVPMRRQWVRRDALAKGTV
jgi:hypothetical protein